MMDNQNFINTLTDWISKAQDIVFFGGAGVSTESGVPDFRSPSGIYAQMGGAEEYLTLGFMNQYPEKFYEFYREYFMKSGIEPNPAHYKLAEMESKNKLTAVVTQNVDGLHQKAGSRRVLEVHGNGTKFYCQRCGTHYSFDDVVATQGPFYCLKNDCGGLVRPDIVMYGESLGNKVLNQSIDAIAKADLVIVGGSSMTVYPAAGLIHYRKPASKLVLVNLDPTPYDGVCDLVAHGPIGELFDRLEIASE